MRRAQTVQPTPSSLLERARLVLAAAPVLSAFASLKEKSTTCRQVIRTMAPSARAQTSSPFRAAPRARPA